MVDMSSEPKKQAGGGSDDVQKSIELLDRVLSEFDDAENGNKVQDPKTRHHHPYGWDFNLQPLPPRPYYRFSSLPCQRGIYPIISPTRIPPRTTPNAYERHREVTRRSSEDNISSDLDELVLRPQNKLGDEEHFSDDSLDEILPSPPPLYNKRSSIAWEVPLDTNETHLTPGSTKVIGRRRRKSSSHSSTSSIPNRLKEFDDWPDPPLCTTEDELTFPFSDSNDHIALPDDLSGSNISGNSTYIIRRCKDDRKMLVQLGSSLNSNSSLNSRLSSDLSVSHIPYSTSLNSRLSRELNTPNSRYTVNICAARSWVSPERNVPKSRYSFDFNNLSQELSSSPSRFTIDLSTSSPPSKYANDFTKHSTTFDNIKSLMKEGVIEHYNPIQNETTSDLNSSTSPIIRVVSLPSLVTEELTPRRELSVTVEEEEITDSPNANSAEISPLRKIEKNISELLERRDIEMLNGLEHFTNEKETWTPTKLPRESFQDLQKSSSHDEIQRSEDYYRQLLIENSAHYQPKRTTVLKSESAKEMISHRDNEQVTITTSTSADFPVRVEVLQYEFPPLPPSPVEEDDEYLEVIPSHLNTRTDTLPVTSEAPLIPPYQEQISNSLRSRSMDACYGRGRRSNYVNTSIHNVALERRTLPIELQTPTKRNFQKCASHNSQEEHQLQSSCSLPETPIFARGCIIPRTPHRRALDVPGNQISPRQSSTMSSINTLGNMSTGGFRRGMSNAGLEQAIVATELLRLAGGPGRGWYPKQRQRRPASIEHLDRLAPGRNPWDSTRKPLTLPPNLTPKFFQSSPRDALRRVTSLLIRKGNSGKEPRKEKGVSSPTIHENANGREEVHKKKGFFKNFWKRSRHYSLEQQ